MWWIICGSSLISYCDKANGRLHKTYDMLWKIAGSTVKYKQYVINGLNHVKSPKLLLQPTYFSTSSSRALHLYYSSTLTEESSNLSSLAPTSPCLELSCTAAATASVHQSCDPAKDKTIQTKVSKKFSGGELNHLVRHNHNLSKVPSLHWLPSVIQLPFSFSALPHLVRKEKSLQTKNRSVHVGMDNKPEHTEWNWIQVVTLLS